MSTVNVPSPAPRNWDSGIKALHWTMAVLIPTAWILAVIREDLPREIAGRLMFFHKSIGLLIVALLVIRVLWRLTHAAPAAEKTPWEPWGELATKAGHGLLYLLMIAAPLIGIATNFANARPLLFFGLFEIASPMAQNRPLAHTLGELHEFAGHALLAVAFAHAVIGILHHVVLKDRTLLKIRPFAHD